MSTRIEVIGRHRAQLGESPVWDGSSGRLLWIDSRAGRLFEADPDQGDSIEHALPAPVGSVALAQGPALVVALKDRVAVYDRAQRRLTPGAAIEVTHPDVRLNDGKADPEGAFVAGTMHINRAPGAAALGGLYRFTRDGGVTVLDRGIGVTNGPCFGADGAALYVADSAARVIWRYRRTAAGEVTDKTLFADLTAEGSAPDGAAVDAEGHLWTALVHKGEVVRLSATGAIERRVILPMRHPTSLAFGAGDTLFVTSISDSGRLRSDEPAAGAVVRLRGLGVGGAPVFRAGFG
ncbi:MAG: SMP-30/gluconolactonase/LRE family protein [Rhodobacter sp.]|nr:SMP-30/gluconolactonase/LRE family protein [Paracoccaceae bacterium]MCC0076582.1 SMP-30/gluconolactonase/LRE family protein [Rhodobacter sp.]